MPLMVRAVHKIIQTPQETNNFTEGAVDSGLEDFSGKSSKVIPAITFLENSIRSHFFNAHARHRNFRGTDITCNEPGAKSSGE